MRSGYHRQHYFISMAPVFLQECDMFLTWVASCCCSSGKDRTVSDCRCKGQTVWTVNSDAKPSNQTPP
ncbi:hypothetical protein ILYODFUR_037279 [Ilyodon furcidens]|uniref:Uncharacterized protein n=1 Tax=Ilyodon furcidens TaxID=33524 RepID=A0ABV0TEA1_9TELE